MVIGWMGWTASLAGPLLVYAALVLSLPGALYLADAPFHLFLVISGVLVTSTSRWAYRLAHKLAKEHLQSHTIAWRIPLAIAHLLTPSWGVLVAALAATASTAGFLSTATAQFLVPPAVILIGIPKFYDVGVLVSSTIEYLRYNRNGNTYPKRNRSRFAVGHILIIPSLIWILYLLVEPWSASASNALFFAGLGLIVVALTALSTILVYPSIDRRPRYVVAFYISASWTVELIMLPTSDQISAEMSAIGQPLAASVVLIGSCLYCNWRLRHQSSCSPLRLSSTERNTCHNDLRPSSGRMGAIGQEIVDFGSAYFRFFPWPGVRWIVRRYNRLGPRAKELLKFGAIASTPFFGIVFLVRRYLIREHLARRPALYFRKFNSSYAAKVLGRVIGPIFNGFYTIECVVHRTQLGYDLSEQTKTMILLSTCAVSDSVWICWVRSRMEVADLMIFDVSGMTPDDSLFRELEMADQMTGRNGALILVSRDDSVARQLASRFSFLIFEYDAQDLVELEYKVKAWAHVNLELMIG